MIYRLELLARAAPHGREVNDNRLSGSGYGIFSGLDIDYFRGGSSLSLGLGDGLGFSSVRLAFGPLLVGTGIACSESDQCCNG